MKNLSVSRRDLAQAIAHLTHVDFDGESWAWELSFNPRTQDPEAHMILVNPEVEPEQSYLYTSERSYNPMAFTTLGDDYRWGEAGTMQSSDSPDGKALEAIRIPEDVREQIEESLLRHVEYDGQTYSIRYY